MGLSKTKSAVEKTNRFTDTEEEEARHNLLADAVVRNPAGHTPAVGAAHILAVIVDHTLVDAAARNPAAAAAHDLVGGHTVELGQRNLAAVRSFVEAEGRSRAAGYTPAVEGDSDFAGRSLVEEAVVRKLPADYSFAVEVVARKPVAAADTKDAVAGRNCQSLAEPSSRPFYRNWDRLLLTAFS